MAVNSFLGTAPAVAQVETYTPDASPATDDVYTLTVTGTDGTTEVVSFTVAGTETVQAVVEGLKAAWDASASSLCTSVTCTEDDTKVTLTANTAGTGFNVAATATGGGSPTLTPATVTHNSGPYEWEIAANWSTREIPGTSADDEVYVEGHTILYGLNQSAISNTLASLNIIGSQIGTTPAAGATPVSLQIKATAVNINDYTGPGSLTMQSPILLNLGSTASTVTVFNSATSSTDPSINIVANSASTNVFLRNGYTGIGAFVGDSVTIGNLTVNRADNTKLATKVAIGDNVTITNFTQHDGTTTGNALGATATIVHGGKATFNGSDTCTALTVDGGTVNCGTSGTITTANAKGSGTLDFSISKTARTVTNMNLDDTANLRFDPGVMTFTNGITQTSTSGIINYKAS